RADLRSDPGCWICGLAPEGGGSCSQTKELLAGRAQSTALAYADYEAHLRGRVVRDFFVDRRAVTCCARSLRHPAFRAFRKFLRVRRHSRRDRYDRCAPPADDPRLWYERAGSDHGTRCAATSESGDSTRLQEREIPRSEEHT